MYSGEGVKLCTMVLLMVLPISMVGDDYGEGRLGFLCCHVCPMYSCYCGLAVKWVGIPRTFLFVRWCWAY